MSNIEPMTRPDKSQSVIKRRSSGVLLHITSLPGSDSRGTLGREAINFIDFLSAAGFGAWQILPIVPTHGDGSPYNGTSSFAGNPELVDFEEFVERGWLEPAEHIRSKSEPGLWVHIYRQFLDSGAVTEQKSFSGFIDKQSFWLRDYALYSILKKKFSGKSWLAWPSRFRDRHPEDLEQLLEDVNTQEFFLAICLQQYYFFKQWQAIKQHAERGNISIIGDVPIFVSHDSVDCWAYPDLFKLDDQKQAIVVAGVPPDYFSATGQRWGNPCYEWDAHKKSNFSWWKKRLHHHFQLFELTRIDHFRGLAACWEIPACEENAVKGQWQKSPGDLLLSSLSSDMGDESVLPIIAEDLGVITEDVEELREKYNFPGMKILQFAFDSDASNPYLPHNHVENCVVYTGTHDNDTTLGWFSGLETSAQQRVNDYFCKPQQKMPWPLVGFALSSVARLVIIPMQDLLALDSESRMNTPGTTTGNWNFRFQWQELEPGLSEKLLTMNKRYGRA